MRYHFTPTKVTVILKKKPENNKVCVKLKKVTKEYTVYSNLSFVFTKKEIRKYTFAYMYT